jgi:hypothetical protein
MPVVILTASQENASQFNKTDLKNSGFGPHVSKHGRGKQNKTIKASIWSLFGKQPTNDSEKKRSKKKPNRHNTTRIDTKQHSPTLTCITFFTC